jgi:hypothetical protein
MQGWANETPPNEASAAAGAEAAAETSTARIRLPADVKKKLEHLASKCPRYKRKQQGSLFDLSLLISDLVNFSEEPGTLFAVAAAAQSAPAAQDDEQESEQPLVAAKKRGRPAADQNTMQCSSTSWEERELAARTIKYAHKKMKAVYVPTNKNARK